MRLYSFVNYYLSQLQAGLQTAHCVSEMSVAYNVETNERDMYRNWAVNHRTIIICNGGNSAMLEDVFSTLAEHAEQYELPLVKFYEDEQSLNNALTSVAIVVPARFYDAKFVKGQEGLGDWYVNVENPSDFFQEGSPEFAFISFLKSFRLA